MKSSLLTLWRKTGLNTSELFTALVLLTLPLPRILNSIAIGLLLIYSLMSFFSRSKKRVRFNFLFIICASFFIFCICSLYWSKDLANSIKSLPRIASYLIIPVAFLLIKKNQIRPIKIIYPFVLVVVFVSLLMLFFAIYEFLKTGDLETLFYHDLSNQFDNFSAIYYSIFVSFSILFLLSKKKNLFEKIMLVFLIQFLILLSSKTVIFITLISSFLFIRKEYLKYYKGIIVVSVILVIMTSFFFRKRIQFEINNSPLYEIWTKKEFGWQYKWSGLGIRTLQARVFNELMTEDKIWITGYGLRAAENRIIDKHKELRLYSGMIGIDLHNQYLQFFLELGFIGLFLHLILFFFLYKSAIKNRDYLFISFLLLVNSICATEIFLSRQRGMVFFLVLSFVYFHFYNSQIKSRLS